jgi:hypothetical protein
MTSRENRAASQPKPRPTPARHASAPAVEAPTCTHHLLRQPGLALLKEGSNESLLATRIDWAGLPTSSPPRTRPMSRRRPAQPAWRCRPTSRRIANEPHEGPRHLMAESKRSKRLAATVGDCSRLEPEAAAIQLQAQRRRLARVVLPERQLPRSSIPDSPRRLETRTIRTLRASGRPNRALIPASYFLGRRNRAFHRAHRRLVCRGRWGTNGRRTKVLFIAGTARWPT